MILAYLLTMLIAAMAATEISEPISMYSIAAAPSLFFINLRKMDSIKSLKAYTRASDGSLEAELMPTQPPAIIVSAGVLALVSHMLSAT